MYKNNKIKRFGGIIMCVISFDFPEEILLSLHKNKDDIANYAKQMCAVDLYSKGEVSLGQGAQIAGMTKEDFIYYLSMNKISIFNFESEEEFLEDIVNA